MLMDYQITVDAASEPNTSVLERMAIYIHHNDLTPYYRA
uniref:Uncharacterized protein n=1 Tax=Arundo donax TaxID=35708 RepID=A0A0A9B878_ARUDO